MARARAKPLILHQREDDFHRFDRAPLQKRLSPFVLAGKVGIVPEQLLQMVLGNLRRGSCRSDNALHALRMRQGVHHLPHTV